MASVRVGDNELFYVEQGSGFPVVLIHGLAGDHTAWTPQLQRLAIRHRVIAFDNRGAGRSTQRDEPVTTEELARDTLDLMDQLEVERAHVIGRSMGGAIAQHMVLLEPERVETLVLCASFARLDPVGARVLMNMREVLEWTGSWEDHARHSVQNFVSTGRDPICSPTATQWLGRIRGSETILFEGSSHFFLLEEPERFMQTIEEWLERRTPA